MFDDKINMQVPHVHFRVRELGEWVDTNTDTYFKDKRVLVFSLPGALHLLVQINNYQVMN